jgi:hypothetical protein
MSDTKPTPAELLKTTKDIYFLLERDLDRILQACTSGKQKKEVISLYSAARDAFWKAKSSALQDNNPTVAAVYRDLKATTKTVKARLQNIKDIVEFLKLVTEAVRLAAAIAALAAAA